MYKLQAPGCARRTERGRKSREMDGESFGCCSVPLARATISPWRRAVPGALNVGGDLAR